MRLQFAAGASAIVLCAAITSASGSGARPGRAPRAPCRRSRKTSRRSSTRTAPAVTGRARSRRCRSSRTTSARPYAKEIRNKVGDGAMPPWHADKAHGKFANERGLSDQEKAIILRWANNGAPQGESEGPASGAEVRRRLGARRAGRGRLDAGRLQSARRRIRRIRVLRDSDELHRGQVGAVGRGQARRARGRAPRDRVDAAAPSRKRGRPASGSRRAWTFPADRPDRPRPGPTPHAAKDRASSRGRSASARSSAGSRPARARSASIPARPC